jgi:hypothetical protein
MRFIKHYSFSHTTPSLQKKKAYSVLVEKSFLFLSFLLLLAPPLPFSAGEPRALTC